jgi:beta-lactamase regulating signal transducer with metallopeptidase domain
MVQTNFLQSLGWAILNSLWQLALLWVVYQVITGIFRKASSSSRSRLATVLLFSGFGWFVVTFISALLKGGNTQQVSSSVFVNPAANETVNEWLQRTLPIASMIYLVLLVLPFMHFMRNYRYVQVIRKFGLTKIEVSWRMFVGNVAGRMGIKRKVQIWVSEFVSSPVTIGFLKPIILVPIAAINHLSPQQLEAILLHELSHIRRHDYLINLLINLIQSVLYFNPFVKAFVKIIEREREKSCDEMVLQFQYNAHEYASALLTLEQAHRSGKPFAMAAAGKKNDLLHRVELIMGVNRKPVFSFQKMAGLMAGLLCVIALQAVLLFVSQTRGNSLAAFPRSTSTSLVAGINSINNPTGLIEQPSRIISNSVSVKPKTPASSLMVPVANPEFIQASFDFAAAPELSQQQEKQVEQAMEASKKILENVQWKLVEKNIAEVFTTKEKEVLKKSFDKQIKKIDWNKWEDKLKLAYNNIDWEKVNAQLAQAVNEVRLDSIKNVYNKALVEMDNVKEQLTANDLQGIPDSDINLKEIETKKAEVRKALTELRSTRSRKIVHL